VFGTDPSSCLVVSEGYGGSKIQAGEKRKKSDERRVFASRSPENVGNNRSVSKSREILSLL